MHLSKTIEENECCLRVRGSYDATRFPLTSGPSILRKLFVFAPDHRRYLILYWEVVVFLYTCVFDHFVCGGRGYIKYEMSVTVVHPLKFKDGIRIKEVQTLLKTVPQEARMAFQPHGRVACFGALCPVGIADGCGVLGGVQSVVERLREGCVSE